MPLIIYPPLGRQTIFPHSSPLCKFKDLSTWGQMNFPGRTTLSQSRKLTVLQRWPCRECGLWGQPHSHLLFLASVSPSLQRCKSLPYLCCRQSVMGMGAEGAWMRASQCLFKREALVSTTGYPGPQLCPFVPPAPSLKRSPSTPRAAGGQCPSSRTYTLKMTLMASPPRGSRP